MANEENEEGATQEKGGKGGIVTIAVTALLASALGGGVSAVLGGKLGATPEAEAESLESVEPGAVDDAAGFQERLFSLDPLVVNVSGKGYARFLKIKIALECESPAVRDEVETRLPQITDAALTLVSSRPLENISDFEGKTLLKQALRERIDQILTSGTIRSVLFTEFVVQ